MAPQPILARLLSILALCLASVTALGQDSAKKDRPADKAAVRAGKVTDPADLEAFFDGVVPVQLEAKSIAGAVVAVVVGDKVVFTKGYGYADVAARRKVDPEKTLFRIASISKLFTWTAVMQQVEEGKLDLDTDINKYLKDVQIPATFEQPITLKHLLTHTPGFDDWVIGLFAHKPEGVGPLAEVLRAQMPTRVRPSGVLASYSNHGTALAGHAVACVSGLSWEDYVEQRILKPLGMTHTLVRQPAEEQLPADMSKGYKWSNGRFEAKGFEYVPAAPAGCMSSTAVDVAQFMLAHLNDGQRGNTRILKPETARRMHEPLFQHDPNVGAMCYGFIEQRRNGQRRIGHGGDTHWFHSLLQLLPAERVGVFVSYNTDTSAGIRDQLFDAFVRRYFPQPEPPRLTAANDFRERAARLVGEYGMTRYSHTSVAKLAALYSTLKVSLNDDDTLTVRIGDTARCYVEKEPLVFRELDGERQIVFKEGKDGQVDYLFLADFAPLSAIRRAWYERSEVQLGLAAATLAIFVSALLFWPAIAFSVRGLQSDTIQRTRFSAVLSCLAWILSLICVVLVAGLAFALSDTAEITFGLTPLVQRLMALPQVCVVLAALTVLGCVAAWKNRYWRVSGRVHYTLVALAGIGFTWIFYYWNLLTFGLKGIVD